MISCAVRCLKIYTNVLRDFILRSFHPVVGTVSGRKSYFFGAQGMDLFYQLKFDSFIWTMLELSACRTFCFTTELEIPPIYQDFFFIKSANCSSNIPSVHHLLLLLVPHNGKAFPIRQQSLGCQEHMEDRELHKHRSHNCLQLQDTLALGPAACQGYWCQNKNIFKMSGKLFNSILSSSLSCQINQTNCLKKETF